MATEKKIFSTEFPNPTIRYLIGEFKFAYIDYDDAIVLGSLDEREEYIHVELPDKENALKCPKVWKKRDWMEYDARVQSLRAKSARERLEANLRTENTQRLTVAMSRKLDLPRELVYAAASKICAFKLVEAARQFGVELELPKE